jgi:hypothetical protein
MRELTTCKRVAAAAHNQTNRATNKTPSITRASECAQESRVCLECAATRRRLFNQREGLMMP